MKWRGAKFFAAGMLVAVLFTGAVYFSLGLRYSAPSRELPTSTPTLVLKPSPAAIVVTRSDLPLGWNSSYSTVLKLSFGYPAHIKIKQSEDANSVFIVLEDQNGYMTIINTCEDRSIMPYDDNPDIKIGQYIAKRYKLTPDSGYSRYAIDLRLDSSRCVNIVQELRTSDLQGARDLFDRILSTFEFTP